MIDAGPDKVIISWGGLSAAWNKTGGGGGIFCQVETNNCWAVITVKLRTLTFKEKR